MTNKTRKAITIYGIKNCDTVKKSVKWLDANEFEITFFDFKKQPLTQDLVTGWFENIDPELLINRRGTTWRKLDEAQKALTAQSDLVQLIIDNPSIIKRPLVNWHDHWSVGFNADKWQQQFL